MRKLLAACLTALLTLTAALPALAHPAVPGHAHDDLHIGTWVAYLGDAVALRPALFGVAVAGAGVWLVTLPFTAFADDPSAFDVLVAEPAEAAFLRCMGCSAGQHH